MRINDLRQKIETDMCLTLGSVYDEIMCATMFRIKSKLEKYCPQVKVKAHISYYSATPCGKDDGKYRARYVVLYSVVLPDEEQREFCIARSFGTCFVDNVFADNYTLLDDIEKSPAEKLAFELEKALDLKKQDLHLLVLDDDYLQKVSMLLWKDHISYYKMHAFNHQHSTKDAVYEPLYITKCADAHRLSINLPKMNKIMWEIVEENVETLKLKRAGEITEYIKRKHQAIDHKKCEIDALQQQIDAANDRKEKIMHDSIGNDLDVVLKRIK